MNDPALHASRLSLGYDSAEDRLVLTAASEAGEAVVLQLTRRMTARLVNEISHLLERSSPLARRAPLDMRGDVILLEHQQALTGPAAPAPAQPAGAAPVSRQPGGRGDGTAGAARLVHAVNITTQPTRFDIVLNGQAEALARFSARRAELHLLLEHLRHTAERADWGINAGAVWLRRESREVAVN